MKTMISSTGNNTDSRFDLRFGRAEWFCLYDEETGTTRFFPNEYKEELHGVAGKVVEKAIDLGAGKVISGDFGPRARDLLERFHIQMVILPDDKQTIGQIIERLKQN
jgi:predicted Fe-Mo cluster-binding NifX family protein